MLKVVLMGEEAERDVRGVIVEFLKTQNMTKTINMDVSSDLIETALEKEIFTPQNLFEALWLQVNSLKRVNSPVQ